MSVNYKTATHQANFGLKDVLLPIGVGTLGLAGTAALTVGAIHGGNRLGNYWYNRRKEAEDRKRLNLSNNYSHSANFNLSTEGAPQKMSPVLPLAFAASLAGIGGLTYRAWKTRKDKERRMGTLAGFSASTPYKTANFFMGMDLDWTPSWQNGLALAGATAGGLYGHYKIKEYFRKRKEEKMLREQPRAQKLNQPVQP